MARSTGLRNAWIISLLAMGRDDRILEIGFGPGVVIQSIAAIATEGFIAGIDASPLMVQQASRRNTQAIQDGRVQLQQGSALALPFEDTSFDKALSINSVQIWPDRDEADSLRLRTWDQMTDIFKPAWHPSRLPGRITLIIFSREAE